MHHGTPAACKGASGLKEFTVQMERQNKTHRTVKVVHINNYYMGN